MRTLLFTLIWIACPLVLAGPIYKWVDANGVIHYSDQPHPDAQKVYLKAAQTYAAPPMPAAAPEGPAPPEAAPAAAYQDCVIEQPHDEQTFANIPSLTVLAHTDPALRAGDRIFITVDGQPVNGGAATGDSFTLTPVDRGTHTAQAVVKDSTGSVVCQSPDVTFYVHQPSVLNPANPLIPHTPPPHPH